MVRVQKWDLFLGPIFRFLVQNFCHTTPILVDDPFLALGMTIIFPPWERFFDFPFRSYSCFRKKIRLTCQKLFPLPTVGAPSASNSPSALSAQALRSRGLDYLVIQGIQFWTIFTVLTCLLCIYIVSSIRSAAILQSLFSGCQAASRGDIKPSVWHRQAPPSPSPAPPPE